MANHKYIIRISKIIQRIKQGDFPSGTVLLSYLSENDFEINKRTLNRDFKTILELFDIEIKYSRTEKGYFFESLDNDFISQKFNETLDLFSSLSLIGKSENIILFEKRKSEGTGFISPIIEAIKLNVELRFNYFNYHTQTTSNREVYPYFIKESQGRWYLIAKDKKDCVIKTFGLDRMSYVAKGDDYFDIPRDNDFEKLFTNYFGIINIGKVKEIRLKINGANAFYVKNYPFHHSQKVLEEEVDFIVFSLSLAITSDFIMEILKYGSSLTVLAPLFLKKEIKNEYQKAIRNLEG